MERKHFYSRNNGIVNIARIDELEAGHFRLRLFQKPVEFFTKKGFTQEDIEGDAINWIAVHGYKFDTEIEAQKSLRKFIGGYYSSIKEAMDAEDLQQEIFSGVFKKKSLKDPEEFMAKLVEAYIESQELHKDYRGIWAESAVDVASEILTGYYANKERSEGDEK